MVMNGFSWWMAFHLAETPKETPKYCSIDYLLDSGSDTLAFAFYIPFFQRVQGGIGEWGDYLFIVTTTTMPGRHSWEKWPKAIQQRFEPKSHKISRYGFGFVFLKSIGEQSNMCFSFFFFLFNKLALEDEPSCQKKKSLAQWKNSSKFAYI